MTDEGIGSVGHYLKPGLAVSLQEESGEALAATIDALSPRSISLKLSRPTPEPSFQNGARVWMKYWDEGATVYRWETRVTEIQGPENQKVVLSISGKEVLVQRRKSYRARLQIPFSLTVIDAVDAELIGAKALECTTQDVSVAGLAFDTDLPLKVGDKLALNLALDPSQQVSAALTPSTPNCLPSASAASMMPSVYNTSVCDGSMVMWALSYLTCLAIPRGRSPTSASLSM